MKKVYHYLNYRKYLSEYYLEKKESTGTFSYQVFSNRAGFKTKDFIYRVIKGQRNLSQVSCSKISKAIGHNKKEVDYFVNLVGFNQSDNPLKKVEFLSRLKEISNDVKQLGESTFLTDEQLGVYAEWYHLVVRSIIDMYSFNGDYEWLSKKVYPPIEPEEAKKSVALLSDLKLISQGEDGIYKVSNKSLSTQWQVKKEAVQNYYLECMQLVAMSMQNVDKDYRNMTNLTLGISQDTYKKMVDKMNMFALEMAEMARSDEKSDRVYNFNLHFIPVTKVD